MNKIGATQLNSAFAYAGPERRQRRDTSVPWTQGMLDELDYGIVLLGPDQRVMLLNHSARTELDQHSVLQVRDRRLRAADAADDAALQDALSASATKGWQRLLGVGQAQERVSLAVVPLMHESTTGHGDRATMVTLGKRRVCERLSVNWYAHSHGLTPAEARVLEALCAGQTPRAIATSLRVGLATVRTQVGSIRQKTTTASIRDLVQEVAVLPPMVGRLRLPT
jgi:DNA-binding CsgD family transcriptional regulator